MHLHFVNAVVPGFELGDLQSVNEGLCWAEIQQVRTGTESLVVKISYDGTGKPYSLFDGALYGLTEFDLTVPVQWKADMPHTRQRGVDNVDVILVAAGRFQIIQVGIVTRCGTFFLTMQEIFAGQAIRTEGGIEIRPTKPEFNYPGADFAKTFQSATARLSEHFAEAELPTEAPVVTWEPTKVEAPKNRQTGHVSFFNPITGTGQIIGADGISYFFHFRDIETPGSFKALAPMTPVSFREHLPREGNGPKAELVQAVS